MHERLRTHLLLLIKLLTDIWTIIAVMRNQPGQLLREIKMCKHAYSQNDGALNIPRINPQRD